MLRMVEPALLVEVTTTPPVPLEVPLPPVEFVPVEPPVVPAPTMGVAPAIPVLMPVTVDMEPVPVVVKTVCEPTTVDTPLDTTAVVEAVTPALPLPELLARAAV